MSDVTALNGAPRAPRGTPAPRHLPHNPDLEQSIIGGVLLDPNSLALLPSLEPSDFYDHRHADIWRAIRNLEHTGTPIDVLTLESEVERIDRLEAVGGIAYLGICAARVPLAANVVEYARQVQDLHLQRVAMLEASWLLEKGYTWGDPVDEFIAEGLARFQRLADRHRETSTPIPFITPGRALEQLDRLAANPVFATPFPELNKALGFGGLLGTQYYTVAAHTGIGKTSFVACIANHAGLEHDVIVATWEMLPGYFVARMAAGPLRVHSNAIVRGEIAGGRVCAAISPGVVFLEEPSLSTLRRAAEEKTAKRGRPPLVIVDYLQLLAAQLARGMERPDPRIAVELASAELRSLAKDLGAVVLGVSATSRTTGRELAQDVRKRSPRELVGAGRDSGSIEFDGAGVIVLSLTDEQDLDGTIATVTVAKARFGQVGHLDYRWIGEYGQWIENGPVQFTPRATKTAPASTETANLSQRDAIVMVLRKAGPLDSKTKIWKLTGGNKKVVFDEIDALVKAEKISLTNGAFATPRNPQLQLVDPVPDPVPEVDR